jgi:hypothetical protein
MQPRSNDADKNLIEEYKYLNDLTLQRSNTVHNLWIAMPTAAGAIVAGAAFAKDARILLLCAPIISMLLASIAFQLDGILRVRTYVKVFHEEKLGLRYEADWYSLLKQSKDSFHKHKGSSTAAATLRGYYCRLFGKYALLWFGLVSVIFSALFAFGPLLVLVWSSTITPERMFQIWVGALAGALMFVPVAVFAIRAFTLRRVQEYTEAWEATRKRPE